MYGIHVFTNLIHLMQTLQKNRTELSSREHNSPQDLFTPATDVAESFAAVWSFLFRWFKDVRESEIRVKPPHFLDRFANNTGLPT
jgi:hypothetical protein